ncbi:MAG: small subunit ribosomal protein, partial [Acidimicrobiaceae bacterium]|nr:small subunit ribosomal protein [Acidimicrobiaceae bacterium]
MSDETATVTATAPAAPPGPAPSNGMGTFDEAGVYTPRQITMDDLGDMSLEDAISGTIVEFDDGDIVKGTVVKVDKDEVLLDIGFKSEGV